MRFLRKELARLRPLSRLAIKLGAATMLAFYIVGFVSRLSAHAAADYFRAMALYRGCMEAAPASLAAGVCAALLGDLMLRDKK